MAIIRQSDPKKWTHVDDTEYEAYCKEKGVDPEKYTTMELLAIAAARQTYDFAFIFAGTGLPMIGCMMAQHTYAPNALIIMEAGILDPKLLEVPISVSEARGGYMCSTLSNMADTFGTFAQRGFCTFGMLGGAECDKYGNLNSTAMGGYYSKSARDDGKTGPAVRFAGSGGANNIASYADMGIAMMVQEKRRFPEVNEFITSCTGTRGPKGTKEDRWHYGLFRGSGTTIVSDLCIFRSNPDTGELVLNVGGDAAQGRRPSDPAERSFLSGTVETRTGVGLGLAYCPFSALRLQLDYRTTAAENVVLPDGRRGDGVQYPQKAG